MSRRRRKTTTIPGEVITKTTQRTGEDEYPPGGGLPKEWDKKPKSDTPIFDQMMAEQYTGHELITR